MTKGFSLVELLVVLILLGVLASLGAIGYLTQVAKARQVAMIAYSSFWVEAQKQNYILEENFQPNIQALDLGGEPPRWYQVEVTASPAEIQLCATPANDNLGLLRPVFSRVYALGVIGDQTGSNTIDVRSAGPTISQC